MGKYIRYAFYKPLFICLTVVLLLLSAGLPAYAAEGAVAPAEDVTPSGIKLSSIENVIDTYNTAARQATGAGVSVAVVKNGETVFNKAYGLADVENDTAADTDTVFEWGSVTKLLVWTSVMQLVEQGKLDLQQDIREYLPEGFLDKLQYDEPITLLNLMHHNAGWQDRYTGLYYLLEEEVPDLAEALRIFEPRQVYKPGTIVAYSNYGAALAGYIVELQSSQPFYAYINEHIFDVLGMEHTSIHPTQQDNPAVGSARDRIQGYTEKVELIEKNRVYFGIYPTGGAIGTTADVAKFIAALIPPNGSSSPLFKNASTLEEMQTPSLSYEGKDVPRNAHGFWVNEHAVRTLEHGGNTAAFSSNLVLDRASGLGIIIMTNQQYEWQYCTGLVDRIFGIYSPKSYQGEMPDSSDVGGAYLPARRPVEGFEKIYGYLSPEVLRATSSRMYNWDGQPSGQFAPDAYSKQNWSATEYFVRNDQGDVIKFSNMTGDYFPLKGLAVNSVSISLVLFGLGAVITLLTFIYKFTGFVIRKFRKTTGTPSNMDKYHLIISTAGLVMIMNNVIMDFRFLSTSTYNSMRIHLILNIIYVLLAAGYIVLLLLKLRRSNSRRMRKVMYMLSGLSAVLFSVLIIGWDLYF